MDHKNVIFPMTAGDLVQSACVVMWKQRGDGPELVIAEVVDVQYSSDNEDLLIITLDGPSFDGSHEKIELRKDTPILITGITRW